MVGDARDGDPVIQANRGSPRVSIGLPVWNGEQFLPEALDSLLGQSFEDFELIVADNASTDRTEAICRDYAGRDRRIRYYRNGRNIGLQANTQKVLDLATAPYFMWACHDDVWDRSYLAKMVHQLDHEDSTVLAASNAASIDENGRVRRNFDHRDVYSPTSNHDRARRLISARPGGAHSWIIVGVLRTETAQRLRLASFDSIRLHNRGRFAWDKQAIFRLVFEGNFYISADTLYFHRDESSDFPSTTEPIKGTVRARLRRAALHGADLHGYFDALRATVLASRLSTTEKVSLVAVSLVQEVRYLFEYYVSRMRR